MLVLRVDRSTTVNHLAFAPDGRSLAAACGSDLYQWREIADGAGAARLPGPVGITSVRFTADGRWLFASAPELWRLDPATGSGPIVPLWGGHNTWFDVSPIAPHVLVAQALHTNSEYRTRLALWCVDDLSSAGKLWEHEDSAYSYLPTRFLGADRFARIDYSRHGEKPGYRVAVHDAATGAPLDAIRFAIPYPYEWQPAPDGRAVAVRGTYQIDLFRTDQLGAAPLRLTNDSRRHFTGMAFHPSGRCLAAASNDTTVKLYDTTTGAFRAFTWELGRMRSVCFSPDGTLAAAGSDKGQVVVWDVDL